jgi:hypothetical protein
LGSGQRAAEMVRRTGGEGVEHDRRARQAQAAYSADQRFGVLNAVLKLPRSGTPGCRELNTQGDVRLSEE